MKKDLNKILLEAIHKGVHLALDDFDDNEELIGQQTLTVNDTNITKTYLMLLDHFIDLDLPSGTLWCKHNVGAMKEDGEFDERWYGGLYSWGETKLKDSYYDVNYKYYEAYTDWSRYKEGQDKFRYSCEHVKCELTKYCLNSKYGYKGYSDSYTQLLPNDDIVTTLTQISNFKIPSKKDFEELLNHTNVEWDNERGYKFISKKDPTKYIFLPTAGFKRDDVNTWRDNGKRQCADYEGIYWTSTLNIMDPHKAMAFEFDSSVTGKPWITVCHRFCGCSIRAIYVN